MIDREINELARDGESMGCPVELLSDARGAMGGILVRKPRHPLDGAAGQRDDSQKEDRVCEQGSKLPICEFGGHVSPCTRDSLCAMGPGQPEELSDYSSSDEDGEDLDRYQSQRGEDVTCSPKLSQGSMEMSGAM